MVKQKYALDHKNVRCMVWALEEGETEMTKAEREEAQRRNAEERERQLLTDMKRRGVL